MTVPVSDEEYVLLKQCAEEEGNLCDFQGLEKLYEYIIDDARSECESWDSKIDEEIDYDNADYMVDILSEFYDDDEE